MGQGLCGGATVLKSGGKVANLAAPWLAVPTTAGTGAEVTRNAVLCVPERHVKVSMRSPFLLPRLALEKPVGFFGRNGRSIRTSADQGVE